MGNAFYRIVRTAIPTADDFLSAQEDGQVLANEQYRREWTEGISVFDSLAYALKRARMGKLKAGSFVATLIVPEDGSIEVRQTGSNRRHYTIYTKGLQALALVWGSTVSAYDEDQ